MFGQTLQKERRMQTEQGEDNTCCEANYPWLRIEAARDAVVSSAETGLSALRETSLRLWDFEVIYFAMR
jgi:hypothetical protein